jgi:hypothetical protein
MSRLKPIALVTRLAGSRRAPVPSVFGNVSRASTTTTAAIGRLIANSHCHGSTARIRPPNVGPVAAAMLVYIAFKPNA